MDITAGDIIFQEEKQQNLLALVKVERSQLYTKHQGPGNPVDPAQTKKKIVFLAEKLDENGPPITGCLPLTLLYKAVTFP